MARNHWLIIALTGSILLLQGCARPDDGSAVRPTAPPPATTAPGTGSVPTGAVEQQIYQNDEYGFALSYPADWVILNPTYRSVELVALQARAWQPANPGELAADPVVRVAAGDYVIERVGPDFFPETINPEAFQAWLERQLRNGEARDLVVYSIDGQPAFEVSEISAGPCSRAVYWRPNDLRSLVKLSTGCSSPYLAEFRAIVDSLRQR